MISRKNNWILAIPFLLISYGFFFAEEILPISTASHISFDNHKEDGLHPVDHISTSKRSRPAVLTDNSISGKVFRDNDSNGTFDGTDTGRDSVVVKLYQDFNQNGVIDGTDTQVATQMTNADGDYSFDFAYDEYSVYDGSVIADTDDGRDDNLGENNLALGKDKWIGVRFQNINIPSGATITSAYLEFEAEADDTNTPSSVNIYAHDTSNPPTFVDVAGGITGLSRTSASASWTFGSWETDSTYQSTNITSVIQELYSSYGAYSGGNMAFILEPTGSEERKAYAHEHSSGAAPRLVIQYTATSTAYIVEVDTLTLPSGASLTTGSTGTALFTGASQSDTGNDFGYSGNNAITGKVFYDQNENAIYDGSDTLAPGVVLELYNDYDYDGVHDNNETVIATTATNENGCYSFDFAYNEYSKYDGYVNSETDDGRDDNLGENELALGKDKWIGVRFQNVNIPADATITNAYLEFEAEDNDSNTPSSVNIYAHDTADPPTFVDVSGGITGLTRTSNNVAWSFDSWTVDNTYQSPDLTSIVQELYSSYGAYSFGNMAFILEPTGSEDRKAYANDHNTGTPPRLVINYTTDSTAFIVKVNTLSIPNQLSLITDNIETATFTSAGQSDSLNHFGYAGNNVIRGNVFHDQNNNATYDGLDTLKSGITINLFKDYNLNGVIDHTDTLVATTTTDSTGHYLFNFSYDLYSIHDGQVSADTDDGRDDNLGESHLALGKDKWIGVRFQDITIPEGSTIENAYLEFTADADDTNTPSSVRIYGQDVSNPPTFVDVSGGITGLTRTSSDVDWTFGSWEQDSVYQSPDLTSIIQELYTSYGEYDAGDIAFILEPTGSQDRVAHAHDDATGPPPRLVIQYTADTTAYVVEIDTLTLPNNAFLSTDNTYTAMFTGTGQSDLNNNFGYTGNNALTGTIFNDINRDTLYNGSDVGLEGISVKIYEDNNQDGAVDGGDTQVGTVASDSSGVYFFDLFSDYNIGYEGSVSADTDDGRDDNLGENHLELGKDKWIGVRFQNIDIPVGATITRAYLEFVAEVDDTNTPSSVEIYAHDVANPSTFVDVAGGITGLTRSSSSVSWTFGTWEQDSTYQSTDVTSIVQELYSSYGAYSSGNMAFIIEPTGSEDRKAYSHDDGSGTPPRLVIHYNTNYYVMEIDSTTIPNGYSFTTDNIETATFTAQLQNDTENDFGLTMIRKITVNPTIRIRVNN